MAGDTAEGAINERMDGLTAQANKHMWLEVDSPDVET